jgi:hypothetical protein
MRSNAGEEVCGLVRTRWTTDAVARERPKENPVFRATAGSYMCSAAGEYVYWPMTKAPYKLLTHVTQLLRVVWVPIHEW